MRTIALAKEMLKNTKSVQNLKCVDLILSFWDTYANTRRKSRMTETGSDGDDNDKNENEEKYDSDAHTPPATLLVLLCNLEVLSPIVHIMRSIHHVVLNVIELFPLCFHHHRHVQEHLVKLQQALLYLLGGVVPVLYLHHCLQHLSSPMFL